MREDSQALDSTGNASAGKPPLQLGGLGEGGCGAMTVKGAQCKAPAMLGKDRCIAHSTDRSVVAIVEAGRRQGGLTRAKQNDAGEEILPRPAHNDPNSLCVFADEVMRRVERGVFSPRQGATVLQGIRTMVDIKTLELAVKVSMLEKEYGIRRPA